MGGGVTIPNTLYSSQITVWLWPLYRTIIIAWSLNALMLSLSPCVCARLSEYWYTVEPIYSNPLKWRHLCVKVKDVSTFHLLPEIGHPSNQDTLICLKVFEIPLFSSNLFTFQSTQLTWKAQLSYTVCIYHDRHKSWWLMECSCSYL